jgi:hypothetical protein
MKVNLTVQERMFLMQAGNQVRGGLGDEKRQNTRELLKKIEISQDQLKLYETPLSTGGVVWNLSAIHVAPAQEFDITGGDCRRAIALVNEWAAFGPNDDDWVMPLLEKLSEN